MPRTPLHPTPDDPCPGCFGEDGDHWSDCIAPTPEHIETIRVGQGVRYALIRDDIACELTTLRAIELQREGVPYVAQPAGEMRCAGDFARFYA